MPNKPDSEILTEFDIVVIGSGPAGATASLFAAKNGLKVLLVDKKQELGAPVQCSGAVSHNAMEQAGVFPSPEFILEAIYGFAIYNTEGEKKVVDYRQIKPNEYGSNNGCKPLGYVVDRRASGRVSGTAGCRTSGTV